MSVRPGQRSPSAGEQLRLHGARPIVAADFSARRRELAAAMGADHVVDPAQVAPWQSWREAAVWRDAARAPALPPWIPGPALRPAVIFECVGVPGVLDQIMAAAPKGSRIVVVGVCMEADTIYPMLGISKELNLQFVLGYTPEEFAALTNPGGSPVRRHVDFRAELLPLIFAEMQARYYIHAASLAGGDVESTEVRTVLRQGWVDGHYEKVVDGLEPRYGRFDPATHLFAGSDRHYTSAADYQGQVYDMIEDDLTEALVPGGSPVKAAQEVLRILRDQLRSVIEFGGLSLDSYVEFQSNVRGRINRLEAGVPPMRSQQLLGLLDAGVVRIPLGPDPELAPCPDGVRLSSTALDEPTAATVDGVVRGYLDMPSLARSGSPLLKRLYANGRLTQLSYGDTPVGSVAINEDFHPYDTEGRLQPNLSVLGVLTEGVRYFTHYLPSPRSRLRAVYDARDCVEAVIG